MLALMAIQSMLLAQPVGHPGPGAWTFCQRTVVSDPAAGAPVQAPEKEDVSALHVEVRALPRRTVRVGEKVELRLAIVNDTPEIVSVVTGAGLTVRVADRRGVEVWTDSPAEIDGIVVGVPAIGCGRRIVPAQPFEFGVTWDLTDTQGRAVPPGEYVAHLRVVMTNDLPAAPPLRIIVTPRSSP